MLNSSLQLILASNSPRRKEILKLAGFNFEVRIKEVKEIYPADLNIEHVPIYLAELKANAFDKLLPTEILLTADTLVMLENKILGKPQNADHAFEMLSLMSGKKHTVISGVCVKTANGTKSFSDCTDVYFKKLSKQEIEFYLDAYKPFDKAGAYGIQDWIGLVGIEKIEGSYYNVMGLPIHLVYKELSMLNEHTNFSYIC